MNARLRRLIGIVAATLGIVVAFGGLSVRVAEAALLALAVCGTLLIIPVSRRVGGTRGIRRLRRTARESSLFGQGCSAVCFGLGFAIIAWVATHVPANHRLGYVGSFFLIASPMFLHDLPPESLDS